MSLPVALALLSVLPGFALAGSPATAFEQLGALAPGPAAAPPAAGPGRDAGPWRHPPLTAADAVSRLCAASEPVLVVDNFVSEKTAPVIDVDGDGIPDAEHGDVIEALYRAAGFRVERFDLRGRRDLPSVAEAFEEIASRAAAGRWRLAAVNLSHVVEVRWEGLSADLGRIPAVTPANIGARRGELFAAVAALMARNDSNGFGDLGHATRRLESLGVPVFVAAGNQTAEKVNLLGLLPGVVSVGALNRRGEKAAFSADSSLVGAWAKGEYAFRRVPSGVDIDGDDVPEFPRSLLSGKATVVSRFAGRPLSEVAGVFPADPWLSNIDRTNPNGVQYLQDRMSDGVYPLEALVEFFRVRPLKARSFAGRGKFFDKTMQYPFEVDGSGRLVFDPAGTGAPGQVGLLPGTSFAPPWLCRSR